MSEVSFIERQNGFTDIRMKDGDIFMGDDLLTAIGISLFTNVRSTEPAFDSEVLNTNQGWWGDVLRESPLGSLIWRHRRSKVDSATLALLRSAAQESLNWLVKNGAAESINVDVKWKEEIRETMDLKVTIQKPSGGSSVFKYQFAWETLEGER